MPDQEPQKDVRLERVPEIDDGALLRIRQTRPVKKATGPIIDHDLEFIDTAIALRPWCLGQVKRTPHEHETRIRDAVDALRAKQSFPELGFSRGLVL